MGNRLDITLEEQITLIRVRGNYLELSYRKDQGQYHTLFFELPEERDTLLRAVEIQKDYLQVVASP